MNNVKQKVFKQVPARFKQSDRGENKMEGFAAAYGNIDQDGEIMARGMFQKSISERVPSGLVKLLDGHEWKSSHTLGTVIEAEEMERGLWTLSDFATTEDAQQIKQKMIEGHIDRLSVGFEPINGERVERNNQKVWRHTEGKLLEVSALPVSANTEAIITSVKQACRSVDHDRFGASDEALVEKILERTFDAHKEELKEVALEEVKKAKGEAGDDTGPSSRMVIEELQNMDMSLGDISEALQGVNEQFDSDVTRSASTLSDILNRNIQNPPKEVLDALSLIKRENEKGGRVQELKSRELKLRSELY